MLGGPKVIYYISYVCRLFREQPTSSFILKNVHINLGKNIWVWRSACCCFGNQWIFFSIWFVYISSQVSPEAQLTTVCALLARRGCCLQKETEKWNLSGSNMQDTKFPLQSFSAYYEIYITIIFSITFGFNKNYRILRCLILNKEEVAVAIIRHTVIQSRKKYLKF